MITKARFQYIDDEGQAWSKVERYTGEVKNKEELEKRAAEWLRDEGIGTGERTRRDFDLITGARFITYEHGDLVIDHDVSVYRYLPMRNGHTRLICRCLHKLKEKMRSEKYEPVYESGWWEMERNK